MDAAAAGPSWPPKPIQRCSGRTPKKDRSPRHGTTQPRVSSGRPTPRCSRHEATSKGGAAEARRNPDVFFFLARRSSAPNAASTAVDG
eukprot:COSAG06_NODE_1307_length_9916_cov_99.462361_6_plen_88_part_00